MRREQGAEAFAAPVLAVAAVLALLANVYAVMSGIAVSPMTPEAASPFTPPQIPDARQSDGKRQTLAAYTETLARPLFRSSRRPIEVSAAAPETADSTQAQQTAPGLPEGTQLAGIVQESGKPGRALIRSAVQPTGDWVEVGHLIDGWRLAEIDAYGIIFEAGGERRTLSLFPAKTQ